MAGFSQVVGVSSTLRFEGIPTDLTNSAFDVPVCRRRCAYRHVLGCFGRSDEWHLVFPNSFQEFKLGFPPWFSEVAIVIRVPFFEPRFISVGTIRYPVTSYRVE
jgi:hypothetical protein